MSVRLYHRGFLVVLLASLLVAITSPPSQGQLLYQESFETDGDGTRYELFDRGHEDTNLPNQASGWGIWGHNFEAPPSEIGIASIAPEKRAAILWTHEEPLNDMADIVTPEALSLWSSVVSWAVDGKANATIGVFPSTIPLGVEVLTNMLEGEGYTIEELLLPEDALANESLDLLIQSSELGSPSFIDLAVPVVTFSEADHDDLGVTQIGQIIDFFDPVQLTIPAEANGHPALGGLTGTIPFTTEPAQLRAPGKAHPGGTTLATVMYEDPLTGEDVEGPALFVMEKGDPLLGAFNPVPEGQGYLIGAGLNKFGDLGEKALILPEIDISGLETVQLTVALAATAADFENADYLRIEAEIDGELPIIIEEFFGVDDATSDCYKGLSNGEFAGEVGPICLPTEAFEDFTFDIPTGGSSLVLRFAALTTWGNEIVGIDNVRVLGPETPTPDGDFNNDGTLDSIDIDDLSGQSAGNSNPPAYDLTSDGLVNADDLTFWIGDLYKSWVGDANLDGEFNSNDLVTVLASGTYEADVTAVWSDGDFNGDGRANTSDLVAALADGGYEAGPKAAVASVPEPTSAAAALVGALLVGFGYRRRR